MSEMRPARIALGRRGVLRRLGGLVLVAVLPRASWAKPPDDAKGQKPKPTGKDGKSHKAQQEGADVSLSVGISLSQARALAVEIGRPTLGYKPLPPGIRKNLARGKPLPPGIARTRLHEAYLSRLPRHPGYEWVAAGTDLMLVALASGLIAEVFLGVFD